VKDRYQRRGSGIALQSIAHIQVFVNNLFL